MGDLDPQDLELLEKLYGIHPEKPAKPKRKRHYFGIVVLLLAVLCVGGMELLACRHFEPVLYNKIVTPVRETAQTAWEAACRTGSAAAAKAEEIADEITETLSNRMEEAKASLLSFVESIGTKEEEPPPTSDLVLDEPEEAPPKEMLDPLVSDLIDRDGREILTGGGVDVVYYNQTDETWSGEKYGSDPLATHGCGPTAMAMVVATLAGEETAPPEMARLCVKKGYWCKNHGSYLSIVQGIANAYGLECEPIDLTTLNEDDLYMRLSTGEIAVALMTKGHFTKGGHFILLRGVTLGGEILVADPASRDRSLIPWDLSLILEELSPSRHDGAPLWFLRAG